MTEKLKKYIALGIFIFAASASATNGVIAVAKPIPRDIAIKKKLLPSDTAASSAAPN